VLSKKKSFCNSDYLRGICSRPLDRESEPVSNFPLGYYEFFLQEIERLGVEVITYKDLFEGSSDWDYESRYPQEYENWKKSKSDSEKIHLLIQHDVDNHPFFTKRMVAMEALYGIKSNIFIFCERYSKSASDVSYDIDHDFFVEAQKHGFVIGYHQNAFALSGFDMSEAVERYRKDVYYLREIYDIQFVVPHGGAGSFINGKKMLNVDVPMPEEFRKNLRWVFNRYGVRFDQKWSDGGLRKTRDKKRVRGFNLIKFLHKLKKGSRNFCLVHPQRWGFNIDVNQNPLLAKEEWYKDICMSY